MVSRVFAGSIAIPLAVAAVSVWAIGQDAPYAPPASVPAPAPNVEQAVAAQDAPAPKISAEELNQLLAPVALYPDALLSQVLMASTYPLEVVQARRWVDAHATLQGDPLANELAKESWDPSVKSLVATPSVLQLMDDKLDWTMKLGDAFLAQQGDVMVTVQQLRAQAQAAGNLQNSEQLRVNTTPATPAVTDQYPAAAAPAPVVQYITIEDTSPDYVYVPVYDPGYVYGSWAYVNYQPFFWTPRTYVPTRGFWYDRPRPCGPAWSYAWGRLDWRQRQLDLDAARAARYRQQLERDVVVQRIRERDEDFRAGRSEQWRHDNTHRLGVGYRDVATARRYTGRDDAVRVQTDRTQADRTRDARPGTPQRPAIPNGSGAIKGQIMPGANPPNNPSRTTPSVTDYPNNRANTDRQRTDPQRSDRSQQDRNSANDRAVTPAQPAPAPQTQTPGRVDRDNTPRGADAPTPPKPTDRPQPDRTQRVIPATPDAPVRDRSVAPAPVPAQPNRETPARRGDAPIQPAPQDAPKAERRVTPTPQPAPAPKADPAPQPPAPKAERQEQPARPAPKADPAPAPTPAPAPRPEPVRPAPAPAPAPAPERPARGSAPERPAPAPERPAPAPERPAPAPERVAPTPAPVAPARDAGSDRGGKSGGDSGKDSGRR